MLVRALDLCLLLICTCIALGLGQWIVGWVVGNDTEEGEQPLFALGAGLPLIAYLILVVGLTRQLRPGVLWTALGVLAFAAAPRVGQVLASRWDSLRSERREKSKNPGTSAWLYLAGLPVVLALAGSLAPPTASEWDSLSYHLAMPKLYLMHHAIEWIPFCPHSNFPFTMEMLYTLGLALRGPIAAKLFHWLAYALTVSAVYYFGKRHLDERAGAIAAFIAATMPIMASEAVSAYVDVALALYTVLTFWAASNALIANRSPRWLVMAGMMAGVAMGIKYLGLVAFMLLLLWMLVAYRAQSRRPGWRTSAAMGLVVALVIASPWYVKNVLWTGNPVFPFAYEVFDGRNWDLPRAQAYEEHQRGFGMGRKPLDYLALPMRVTLWPWNYNPRASTKRFEMFPSIGSAIGPAYLVFLTTLLLISRPPPVVKALTLTGLSLFTAWAVLMQYNRYLLPCLCVLSLPVGFAAEEMMRRSQPTRWAAVGALSFCGLLGVVTTTLLVAPALPVIFGTVGEEAYLARSFDGYEACQYINDHLPEGVEILTLGEPRGFYLNRDYLWGDPMQHKMIPYETIATPQQLVREYRRLGVSHVLVHTGYFPYFTGGAPLHRIVREAVDLGLLVLVYSDQSHALFELNDEPLGDRI